MAEWYGVEDARDDWADAAQMEDGQLLDILESAKQAVLAFAPVGSAGEYIVDEDGYIVPVTEDTVPVNYRTAQLMQARNIWNSGKASPSGDFDNGQYGLSSFPLDWAVRQLIRPKRGVPVIG